jgi:hypothetical protein
MNSIQHNIIIILYWSLSPDKMPINILRLQPVWNSMYLITIMVFTASPMRRLVLALASGWDLNRGVCLTMTVSRMVSPRTPRRPPRRRWMPHERESGRAGKSVCEERREAFPRAGTHAYTPARVAPIAAARGERETERDVPEKCYCFVLCASAIFLVVYWSPPLCSVHVFW